MMIAHHAHLIFKEIKNGSSGAPLCSTTSGRLSLGSLLATWRFSCGGLCFLVCLGLNVCCDRCLGVLALCWSFRRGDRHDLLLVNPAAHLVLFQFLAVQVLHCAAPPL